MQEQESERIRRLQQRFGLDYQISFALIGEKKVQFQGKKVLEVGGNLPKELVIDELNASQWVCVDLYLEELLETIKMHQQDIRHSKRLSEISDYRELETHLLLRGAIEDLPECLYEKFDIVFSIASFEHFVRFPLSLDRMYSALKNGGRLFTLFSPIWPSINGHHIWGIKDKLGNEINFGNSPIPPWGHLLMTPPELYQYLLHHTDKETATDIIHEVYHAPGINRYFVEDYVAFVKNSLFSVIDIQLYFHTPIKSDIQKRLEQMYPGRKCFQHQGLLMVLQRET